MFYYSHFCIFYNETPFNLKGVSKTPLRLCNAIGLIDAGYRGEIMAAVDNIKQESYELEKGQRLFQLVSMDGGPIYFELVDILSTSKRGEGGFGSTGK